MVLFSSKTFPTLKHFVVYFLDIRQLLYVSSITTIFIKDITLAWSGGSGSCCCGGLEKNYARVNSWLILECCPHDHWRSRVKLFCAKDTAVVHNGFNTHRQIIDIKKFNVVFNCTSCIEWQPLYTATATVFSIRLEKPSNTYFTRCN